MNQEGSFPQPLENNKANDRAAADSLINAEIGRPDGKVKIIKDKSEAKGIPKKLDHAVEAKDSIVKSVPVGTMLALIYQIIIQNYNDIGVELDGFGEADDPKVAELINYFNVVLDKRGQNFMGMLLAEPAISVFRMKDPKAMRRLGKQLEESHVIDQGITLKIYARYLKQFVERNGGQEVDEETAEKIERCNKKLAEFRLKNITPITDQEATVFIKEVADDILNNLR